MLKGDIFQYRFVLKQNGCKLIDTAAAGGKEYCWSSGVVVVFHLYACVHTQCVYSFVFVACTYNLLSQALCFYIKKPPKISCDKEQILFHICLHLLAQRDAHCSGRNGHQCCFRMTRLCLPGHVVGLVCVDVCAAFAVAVQDSACCKCQPSSGVCAAHALVGRRKCRCCRSQPLI